MANAIDKFSMVQLPGEDRPRGLCWCGCGQPTPIAKRNRPEQKAVRGVPVRYLQRHSANAPFNLKLPVYLRLFPQLVIDPSGCLLWTGCTDRNGYGRIKIDGREHAVHRVMYELFVGPIPDGLEIDHVRARGCRNRNCGSPAHLEPVTPRENVLRGDGVAAKHAAATHCGACGTPYDEKNTYRYKGCRVCRNCRNIRSRKRRAERRGKSS